MLLLLFLIIPAQCLNILLTSEDSWVSENVRTLHSTLSKFHNVVMVAPVQDVSSYAGSVFISDSPVIESDELAEFGYGVKAGDASFGRDESDPSIWYVDASTVGSVVVGLDYIVPQFYNNVSIDLVIAGPKEGSTIGPLERLQSGVFAAMQFCALRNIPAVAISTMDDTHRFFNPETPELERDSPARIVAEHTVQLVAKLESFSQAQHYGTHQSFATSKSKYIDQSGSKFHEEDYTHDTADFQNETPRLLPSGLGLNVNFPMTGLRSQTRCRAPRFVQSRSEGSYSLTPTVELVDGKFQVSQVYQTNEWDNALLARYRSDRSLSESCSVSVTAVDAMGNDVVFAELGEILDQDSAPEFTASAVHTDAGVLQEILANLAPRL